VPAHLKKNKHQLQEASPAVYLAKVQFASLDRVYLVTAMFSLIRQKQAHGANVLEQKPWQVLSSVTWDVVHANTHGHV